MSNRWRSWLIVGVVLLAAHGISAWHAAARFADRQIWSTAGPLKLDMTPEQWACALGGCDSASYLRVAENFAAGRGITLPATASGQTRDQPFFYWAPGAPIVFGSWMWLFGGKTMWSLFWFAVSAQAVFGVFAIATASLWTRNTWALAAVAFCTGVCPPLQQWFYGASLTSSEIVSLVPLSAIMFVLAKGFIAYHESNGTFWARALDRRVARWFAIAGVLIGLNSLVRDSSEVLATFIAVFVVGQALVRDRRRLALAGCAAAVLLAGNCAVRAPVKLWNKHRVGHPVVSTGATYGLWYLSLWGQHDRYDWYTICGVGCGEYLDPAAAKRVEAYFSNRKPHPAFYSLSQFAGAVWKRPLDALAFKAVRQPVLWLGSNELLPRIHWTLVPIWCAAFYASLAAFCVIQWGRGRRVPEVLYLCLLMMVCASALVHYEFRYTFPIWNTLVMAPGLLLAAFARDCSLEAEQEISPADELSVAAKLEFTLQRVGQGHAEA